VTLRDRDGREVARVPEVALQVSPRGLLFDRRLLVQEIALAGADLRCRARRTGRVALAFGSGEARRRAGEGLASLPDQFERLFERPALPSSDDPGGRASW
jgi:hypothetical protein